MATLQAAVSNVVVISSTVTRYTDTFMVSVTGSAVEAFQVALPAGISQYVLSFAAASNYKFLYMKATGLVRVNFIGVASMVSAASAGWQFQDIFAQAGSGMTSGFSALAFANSSADSATVTGFVAM